MINLNISQNNEVTKPSSDNIIEFLYQLSKSLDDNAYQYLCGRIEIPHGYADAIEFLESKFEDLRIVSSGDPYIRFESTETGTRCAEKFGDGIGTTITDARLVTQFEGAHFYGSNIGSFDELRYFTNVHTLRHECFMSCRNLTSIDLINISALDGSSTFSNCTSLTTLKNYQNITRCGNNVFNNCDLTGDFDFSNITEINNTAKDALGFAHNTNITSVKLPEVQETMCSFYNCTNLKHITNGINIKTIGHERLIGCTSLEELDFPNLETIQSNNACYGCTSLTSISFPKLTTLGSGAFINCTNLKTVNLPNLLYLGDSAFHGTAIETIDLSSVLPFAGDYHGSGIFKNCKQLKTVIIPQITTIGQSMFESCSALETLDINWENITSIGGWGLDYCNSFTNHGEPIVLTNCLTCKSIPPYVETIKLPAITSFNSLSGAGVKHLELNSSLTTLNGTMRDMKQLQSVSGLSNIENITVDRLFQYNIALSSLDFSSKLKVIPNSSFYECVILEHLTSSNDIIVQPTEIKQSGFFRCRMLSSDRLDLSQCTSIGNSAFEECLNITSVNLSACTSIGNYAFYKCSKLTSIGTLSNTLTTISSGCFKECELLINVTLPTTCTTIGDQAFYNCKKITSIDISNVTSLAAAAFMNCESLQSFGSFNETLTEIPKQLFWGCTNLTGHIVIPAGVTKLGGACFCDCKALLSIKFQSVEPPVWGGEYYTPFMHYGDNLIIYVPEASLDKYLAVNYFNQVSALIQTY